MTFTVYSKDGCPFCVKVKKVLELAELRHVEYKLGRDFDREEFIGQFGNDSTFPQVVLTTDKTLVGVMKQLSI